MLLKLVPIEYDELKARQKENYNFLKVSSVLADYGFMTMRLTDDWQGADFIAQHIDGETFLKVQLKGRLTFDQKYYGKNIYVTFFNRPESCWYLYPHDELFDVVRDVHGLERTTSWTEQGEYHFPELSKTLVEILKAYKIEHRSADPVAD